jgi:bleomycin hydrolase
MKGILPLLLLALVAACATEDEQFAIEVLNSYTPVKNQGRSQMCWAYAMLAAIETEHIMRGDSVHLSVAWVERMIEREKNAPKSKRGVGQTLISMIQKYGLVPYDAMPDTSKQVPRWAFMLGAQYTPLEFAHSVCRPDEYVALGTSDKHPLFEEYVFDVPDNWEQNKLLNLTPDSLLAVTEKAVRLHHGVCWEGDISEKGFDWKQGVARLGLVNGKTTDDHCMAIVGIARDGEGKPFFVMKNSWGTGNSRKGLLMMSFDYFREKTLAIYLPADVLTTPVPEQSGTKGMEWPIQP